MKDFTLNQDANLKFFAKLNAFIDAAFDVFLTIQYFV